MILPFGQMKTTRCELKLNSNLFFFHVPFYYFSKLCLTSLPMPLLLIGIQPGHLPVLAAVAAR